jgi:O-acetyl-ADP-ribose deacetylase (regulator of RNase III)
MHSGLSIQQRSEPWAAGIRFGRTVLSVVIGPIVETGAEALMCPANRRGVMGVGVAGAIRLHGGAEVEREIMAQAPLTTGVAYKTSAGELAAMGTRLVIHAVVSSELGAPSREDVIRRATASAIAIAERERARTVVVPPLGAGLGERMIPAHQAILLTIEEIIAHLRRSISRIERISFLCRDEREARATFEALSEARTLWTGVRGHVQTGRT